MRVYVDGRMVSKHIRRSTQSVCIHAKALTFSTPSHGWRERTLDCRLRLLHRQKTPSPSRRRRNWIPRQRRRESRRIGSERRTKGLKKKTKCFYSRPGMIQRNCSFNIMMVLINIAIAYVHTYLYVRNCEKRV